MTLLKPFDPWQSTLCTCLNKLTFNPYTGCDHMCVYCYATSYIPSFHQCRPKTDLIPRLEKEANHLKGELISLSNSSDPYPTLEAELGLTRKCLQILSTKNCKIQIITKSNLITRDIMLLKKVPSIISITITTENDELAKKLEPNAPSPTQRLKAVETLTQHEIPVTARIDPIIPTVNDNPTQLIKTLAALAVKHITASTYKVKKDNWRRFSTAFPETAKQLMPLYFQKGQKTNGYHYLPKQLRYNLMKKLKEQTEQEGMNFGTCREGLPELNTTTCDGAELIQQQPVNQLTLGSIHLGTLRNYPDLRASLRES